MAPVQSEHPLHLSSVTKLSSAAVGIKTDLFVAKHLNYAIYSKSETNQKFIFIHPDCHILQHAIANTSHRIFSHKVKKKKKNKEMKGNLVISYNGLHCISGIASVWVVHIKCNLSLEKGYYIQHSAVQEQRTGKAMDRDKLTSSVNY